MNIFDLSKYESHIFEIMNNFIVIGAFDGEGHDTFLSSALKKSNKLGSTIVFVEPIPNSFEKLKQKNSSIVDYSIKCYNFAISDIKKTNLMVSVKPELQWKYGPYIDECSCILDEGVPTNHFMGDVQLKDLNFTEIETITFQELFLLSELNSVDFLKIDTEGCDERILNSINFDSLNLKFLKFERTFLSEGFIDKIYQKLHTLGFLINLTEDNVHFLHKSIIQQIDNN
jgi:FkbM family methyltransferase